ncbi:hypothetical protein N7492_004630 [Penicillium capsulatum]|uniref:Calcineurin-like phosphoesterase domain-containing protein n=1 Tax=Penicillium capsulatum TaxID=69766 RepID=A0A9W9IE99_9EURO|nr:hypothetical protein N7492_004630 [Penicillium capsulatum]KAJ6136255.1 hypothetical protein N7512_001415 [Penicillium capsulatum]
MTSSILYLLPVQDYLQLPDPSFFIVRSYYQSFSMGETKLAKPATIKTRFLVISNTHGLESLPDSVLGSHANVAIHCGDLTTESKIEEYKVSIRLLQKVDAHLNLVIAGNHDFTMNTPVFQRKVAESRSHLDPRLVKKVYGSHGDVRMLFGEETGITFLDEGTHQFQLQNGAPLSVYASPYTPSLGDWGFQYHPDHGHNYSIHDVDVVMTHGPPRGVLDHTQSGERAGCSYLFQAIARSRPRLHCFGHIHEGWGGKLITWRRNTSSNPSHLTDIDNENSILIDKLSNVTEKETLQCSTTSHCSGDENPLQWGFQTLFINASIEGMEDFPAQTPWLVDLELRSVL